MMIAIDADLVSTLQATLEATRLELHRVSQQQTGNDPFTLKEACAYLKVSRSTLSEYIKRDEIKPSEYGSRVWVTRAELDRFIARHKRA